MVFIDGSEGATVQLAQCCRPIPGDALVGYLGPALAGIMTGSLIVELIFNLPGVGRYFVQGALNRDYPLVMGVVVIYATFIILFNLLSDLAYAALDPRVRKSYR